MKERIRKLAKLYEENSYQAMKQAFEEQWKTAADWSKEEKISFARFVSRLMIVKEDFAAAEKYFTDYFTEDEDFSKYKEIIGKNKAEIAKQYEEEKAPVVNCVFYRDWWGGGCARYGKKCPGKEYCLLKEEPCKYYNSNYGCGWCSFYDKKCPGNADCQLPYEKRIPCKYYNNNYGRGWCSFCNKKCPGDADCQLPYEKRITM